MFSHYVLYTLLKPPVYSFPIYCHFPVISHRLPQFLFLNTVEAQFSLCFVPISEGKMTYFLGKANFSTSALWAYILILLQGLGILILSHIFRLFFFVFFCFIISFCLEGRGLYILSCLSPKDSFSQFEVLLRYSTSYFLVETLLCYVLETMNT